MTNSKNKTKYREKELYHRMKYSIVILQHNSNLVMNIKQVIKILGKSEGAIMKNQIGFSMYEKGSRCKKELTIEPYFYLHNKLNYF